MKSFEERLLSNFKREHRSYLINTNHLTAIDGNSVYIKDKLIPVGETYRKEFKNMNL